jgi:hypothetical protein
MHITGLATTMRNKGVAKQGFFMRATTCTHKKGIKTFNQE